MERRNKFRVLVDWDNDGFHNVGVPIGTPTNLIPYSPYVRSVYPHSGTLSVGTPVDIVYTPTVYGLAAAINVGSFGSRPLSQVESGFWQLADCIYPILPASTYTLVFYVKNATAGELRLWKTIFGLNSLDGSTVVSIPASPTEFQRISVSITAHATLLRGWIAELVGLGANELIGVQLYEGTINCVYNTGELSAYDNIGSYVLSASWELGRSEFDEPMAYEGTARIKLNNDSKIFSPANTDSPLYSSLRKNLLVKLQYEIAINEWETVWTGWTSEFKTTTGRTSTRQSELICTQGIYRLRDGVLDFEFTDTKTVNDAIIEIIRNSGYRSTYYPLMAVLNLKSKLGWNTFLQDVEELFSELSDSSNRQISGIGANWGRKTTPSDAIKEILTSEHSKLWLDRDGGFVLRHREDHANTVADYEINLGTEVQEANYRYSEDVINRVEVIVKPRKEVTNEVIWQTKDPIFIQGHPFGDGRLALYTRYIEMQFEFEEGKQRTITDIDGRSISDMTVTVYNRNPRLYRNPTPYVVPQGTWNNQVHATVLGHDSLRKRLQVRNNLSYAVWIDIAVTGNYSEGGEGGVYVVDDLEAQEALNAIQSMTIELPSATTEAEALSHANFILNRKANPTGEFNTLLVRDDPTLKIGDILSLTEEQTGEVARRHIIIGESGDYGSGAVLEIEYALALLDDQLYMTVDEDEFLRGIPNPIEDMLEAIVFSGHAKEEAVVITPEGEKAFRLYGSNQNIAFIGNIEGQYLNRFKADVDYTTAPDTINFYDESLLGDGFRWGINFTGTNQDIQDFDYNNIAELMPIGTGVSLWTGVKTGGTYYIDIYRVSDGNQVDNSVISNPLLPIEMNNTETTVTVYGRLNRTVGGDVRFGHLTIINYPSVVTEKLALEGGVVHYLHLWTASNSAATLQVKIIAADGTKIHDENIAIASGLSRTLMDFTTVVGNCSAHAIILHYVTTNWIDIYGIGVSPDQYDTYQEMNSRSKNLPVMYI